MGIEIAEWPLSVELHLTTIAARTQAVGMAWPGTGPPEEGERIPL